MVSEVSKTPYIISTTVFIPSAPEYSHGANSENDVTTIVNYSNYVDLLNLSNDHILVPMVNNVTASFEEVVVQTKHPVVGVILAMFTFITILGNMLVITAVVKELYLRTITNYLIVSLAIADVMVGGIVMPFSISLEMNNNIWYYGTTWCDLWHSFDVLGSSASILNLCLISLDRYWAITDPIAYPNRMSPFRVSVLIAFVWFCSAAISFPAIAWWKAVTPSNLPDNVCLFTDDSAYLIFSSLVSFYFPTIVMIFVYIRIYRAARNQRKSIETGTKVLTSNRLFGAKGVMTLRIHRGGMAKLRSPTTAPESTPFQKQSSSDEEDTSMTSINQTPVHTSHHAVTNHDNNANDTDSNQQNQRPMKFITKRLRHLALSKKLSKLAKEQKAAKTLGIVVGVFILCWLPFFVLNIILGICGADCVSSPDIVFPIFTWFGYINSGVNPIIYALSMRDFRRAFGRIVFCCCPRYRFYHNRRRQKTCRSTASSSFIGSALI